MKPLYSSIVGAAFLFVGAVSIQALETPFTAYKDGYAAVSLYTGNSRTLLVRSGDYKAWVSHALADGSGQGLLKAHLQVYVKDVVKDGKLIVWLGSSLTTLENQTHFTDLRTRDTVGSIDLLGSKHIQAMIDIPLSAAFVKSIVDGNSTGLVLEGGSGLDAELGALESSHGAILYLDYGSANPAAQAKLVDSVAAALASKYAAELKGGKGDKGDLGTKGDAGPQGAQGLQGINGIKGDKGEPGDSPTLFNLVLDRGQRANYSFDAFRGLPQTTPDSSGQGNTLTLSINGLTKVQKSAGDSAILFIGAGYASAPNTQSLNPYKEISVSAQLRLTADHVADSQTVISKANQYEIAIYNQRLRCRFKTVLGSFDWVGSTKIDTGWHTIQASYDGDAIRLFLDGVQSAFQQYPNGPVAADSGALFVGARNATDYMMWGTIDNVKILSYAVGKQDSIGLIPGLLTRSQLLADSVTGLDARLGAKSDTSHGHAISKISGLQSALDAKANLSGAGFSGNVGIGTSTPGAPLAIEINGSTVAKDTTLARFTYKTNTGRSADLHIDFRGASAGDGSLAFRESRADKDFLTVNMLSNPSVEPKVVFPTGKVGIGISSPAGYLDVRPQDTTAGKPGAPTVISAQAGAIGKPGGNLVLSSGANGPGSGNGHLIFAVGSNIDASGMVVSGEAMRIDSTGNIGIGISKPTAVLNIHRDGLATDLVRIQGNSSGNAPLKALSLRHNNTPNAGNVGQAVDIDFTVERSDLSAQIEAARIRAGKESDFTSAANADSYLGFYTTKDGAIAEKIRINSSGDLQASRAIFLNNSTANGMMISDSAKIKAAGPQNFLRILKNDGVFGSNAVVGNLYVYATNAANHGKAQSDVYAVATTGNGISNSLFQNIITQARMDGGGTSPVQSINIANDGSSGAILFQITKNTGVDSLEVYATFVGTVH
jgi:hypothetical protein